MSTSGNDNSIAWQSPGNVRQPCSWAHFCEVGSDYEQNVVRKEGFSDDVLSRPRWGCSDLGDHNESSSSTFDGGSNYAEEHAFEVFFLENSRLHQQDGIAFLLESIGRVNSFVWEFFFIKKIVSNELIK